MNHQLNEFLKDNDMTKAKLAEIIGCSAGTISRLSKGFSVSSAIHSKLIEITEGAVNPTIRERGNLKGVGFKRGHYQGTHNASKTLEYQLWCRMRYACNCPTSARYKKYGALGVTMCPEWEKFPAFLKDMGKIPEGCKSLVLKPVNCIFEKNSCRWSRDARGRPARPKKRRIKGKVVYSYPKKNKALNGLLKLVQMEITEKSEVIWN